MVIAGVHNYAVSDRQGCAIDRSRCVVGRSLVRAIIDFIIAPSMFDVAINVAIILIV